MKIATWNCNGALRKKTYILDTLDADVCIVQECENPTTCSDAVYKKWAKNHLWVGTNKNKGLGVFAKPDISLAPITLNAQALALFLPCMLENRLQLLAVWTKQTNSPTFGYIGQLWKYLQLHPCFLKTSNALLIGDLNSNTCWDKKHPGCSHSDVVEQLKDRGLKSVYHYLRQENQGKESTPTFFLHRKIQKPYHIDYAFLSSPFLQTVSLEIGSANKWLEHSDHLPLVIDFDLDATEVNDECT